MQLYKNLVNVSLIILGNKNELKFHLSTTWFFFSLLRYQLWESVCACVHVCVCACARVCVCVCVRWKGEGMLFPCLTLSCHLFHAVCQFIKYMFITSLYSLFFVGRFNVLYNSDFPINIFNKSWTMNFHEGV